jgi:hypothetical protein
MHPSAFTVTWWCLAKKAIDVNGMALLLLLLLLFTDQVPPRQSCRVCPVG